MQEDIDIQGNSEKVLDSSKDQEKRLPTKEGEQTNPIGNELNILVSLPESLEIKMVNASILADYEIWIFISSVLSSVMSGFWVAFTQTKDNAVRNILFWNSLIFTILFLAAVIVAFTKRSKLNKKSKSIKLKATKQE
jgi:hypothetical protein